MTRMMGLLLVIGAPIMLAFFPFFMALSGGATAAESWAFYAGSPLLGPSLTLAAFAFSFFAWGWIGTWNERVRQTDFSQRLEAIQLEMTDLDQQKREILNDNEISPATARAKLRWLQERTRLIALKDNASALVLEAKDRYKIL